MRSPMLWCLVAAFGTYFCMYAFRKPFTAASFSDVTLGGFNFKIVLVISQVLGYTLSKFLGIKVVSEAAPHRRAWVLLQLIGAAQLALLLFGLTPPPYNFIWLFCNGLALGIVFGLVLGALEGRRQTELLMAGLCTSFIVADGVAKSVGAYLLQWGVSEFWMPFMSGVLFTPPFLLFVWMMSRIPAPNKQDIEARSERSPMNSAERRQFFWRYALGLALLVSSYLLVTILRSIRADFAPEIWAGLQAEVKSSVFAWSEMAVALGVMILHGSVVLIRDNRRAFFTALFIAVLGTVLVAGSLVGLRSHLLSPFAFMVLIGLGLYLPYIAVHTTIFERLIAMTRDRGNIGYLMYLADAFGYLGYVMVLLIRNLFSPQGDMLPLFVSLSWLTAGACAILLVACGYYFAIHPGVRRQQVLQPVSPAGTEIGSNV